MDVTPEELRSTEIKEAFRGYSKDEVDDLLERAAAAIETLEHQLQAGGAAAGGPAPLPTPSRDDADMLQRTLMLAQRAADDAVNEAQARARQMVDEAEVKAQALVSDAEANARRIAEGERRRLEVEIEELADRRSKLSIDADALETYAAGYRDRLRAAIEADLASLGSAVDAPGPRPELHAVEVAPAQSEPSPAQREPPEPTPAVFAASEPEPAEGAAPPEASGETAAWPPPSAQAAASSAAQDDPPAWLQGNDDWARADSWEAPGPWQHATAEHEAFSAEAPMEAKAVDSESLDDDEFFASLRDAVRDDSALGPREEQPYVEVEDVDLDDRRRFRRRR